MRTLVPLFTILALAPLGAAGREPTASPTETLKDSIREWIEVNREIQVLENEWERDREVLQAHRDGLETEIADLKEQIASTREGQGAIDGKAQKIGDEYDSLKKASDRLEDKLVGLERSAIERVRRFPPMLLKDGRVQQMISDLETAVAKGKDSGISVNARLNQVLNLVAEAEKFQGLVQVDADTREVSDGSERKINLVYFGLSVAYGVDEGGEFGFVGKPGAEGWVFEAEDELAPRIKQLLDVLNGDVDARFVTLPIALP